MSDDIALIALVDAIIELWDKAACGMVESFLRPPLEMWLRRTLSGAPPPPNEN